MLSEFYIPILKEAIKYDRVSGYFSTKSLALASRGFSEFCKKENSRMRLIIGGQLPKEDYEVIRYIFENPSLFEKRIEKALNNQLDSSIPDFEKDRMCGLAWMLKHDKLEIKVGFMLDENGNLIPPNEAEFHHKFGIFTDEVGDQVGFQGSLNETFRGWGKNGETITVYRSWISGHQVFVNELSNLFERLWSINGIDETLSVAIIDLPTAVRENWIQKFPPRHPAEIGEPTPFTKKKEVRDLDNKWWHQEDAVNWFINEANGTGLLAMATGTGKTITSLKIIQQLYEKGEIDSVVICASERLLNQWSKEIRKQLPNSIVFWKISGKHQDDYFLRRKEKGKNRLPILLVTDHFLKDFVVKLNDGSSSFFIYDEVHHLGSYQNRQFFGYGMSNRLWKFGYRLGLSATPFSKFNPLRNKFIAETFSREELNHIDFQSSEFEEILKDEKILFTFGLADAISRGILCEFDYVPLVYQPTDEELEEKRKEYQKWIGMPSDDPETDNEALARIMASNVLKRAQSKLPVFANFLKKNPDILENCIIFVHDTEFGRLVSNILIKYSTNFKEYFSGEDSKVLTDFSKGELKTLIACRMISEGIDIHGIKNIILFSSDAQLLETIQRMGRALRFDPNDPNKRAKVVDFIYEEEYDPNGDYVPPDITRREWLSKLSKTRRENND